MEIVMTFDLFAANSCGKPDPSSKFFNLGMKPLICARKAQEDSYVQN